MSLIDIEISVVSQAYKGVRLGFMNRYCRVGGGVVVGIILVRWTVRPPRPRPNFGFELCEVCGARSPVPECSVPRGAGRRAHAVERQFVWRELGEAGDHSSRWGGWPSRLAATWPGRCLGRSRALITAAV